MALLASWIRTWRYSFSPSAKQGARRSPHAINWRGKVAEVTLGDIMAHAVVKIGRSQIESVITRRSAEQLQL
ncbi:MAG: TOBE domain-containing protein [Acidobacteriota bacterium]